MNALLLLIVPFAGYLIAYYTYGRFLARKIFQLDPQAEVPSRELEDGIDYVPTRKGIIFGHHYTSIAGTGPIVGPAIGIIWGWVPALIWVFVGSIVMGAVHDLGSLVVSLRNQGRSLSEITAKYINPRVRTIFFLIIFLELWIVIAVFALVSAAILAFATGASGQGALTLWPLFGAVNQLLAALALLVITLYLKRKGGLKYLVTALPCLFMLVMTLWAVIVNERNFIADKNGSSSSSMPPHCSSPSGCSSKPPPHSQD